MDVPPYQQLSGILTYCYTALREDTYLTAASGLNADPDDILRTVVPYKVFEQGRDGLGLYVDIKKMNLPVLSIHPTKWDDWNEQVGDAGMLTTLGIQYLFPARAASSLHAREAKAVYFGHAVWWRLREHLRNPASALTAYHIKHVATDGGATMLPPVGHPVRGFEGLAQMAYIWPPWQTTSTAVDFDAHSGTMAEQTEPDDEYVVSATELTHPWSEEE